MDDHVTHICITGPESTGKSTLSKLLANRFSVECASEYARDYLSDNQDYKYDDLLKMARGQQALIHQVAARSKSLFFSDTDLLTIVIWSKYIFGKVDMDIYRTWKENLPDKYLLCAVDIPWEEDPLREHPHQREEIFLIYKKYIENCGVPYELVEGDRRAFVGAYDL